MITNSAAYYRSLNYQAKLNVIITGGNTTGFSPNMLILGIPWAQTMLAAMAIVTTAYLNAIPIGPGLPDGPA